jgi:hypothetical protein
VTTTTTPTSETTTSGTTTAGTTTPGTTTPATTTTAAGSKSFISSKIYLSLFLSSVFKWIIHIPSVFIGFNIDINST